MILVYYWSLILLFSYGTDHLRMKWDDVDCASNTYLSIAQCYYSTYIDGGCTNTNSYDATVYCCKFVSTNQIQQKQHVNSLYDNFVRCINSFSIKIIIVIVYCFLCVLCLQSKLVNNNNCYDFTL